MLLLKGYFPSSRVGATGISHQRITYKPKTGFYLKYTKNKQVKKIRARVSLPVFVAKHIGGELRLKIPCAGSPYGFLYGAGAKHERNTDIDGYEIISDSDSE